MVLRIQELRRQRGMKIKQLASEMGIAIHTAMSWECETYLPKTRDLPLLARVLGCSISELFVEVQRKPARPTYSIPQGE